MARAQLPYKVYAKRRTTKSGKKTVVYYYSLNPDCGLPPEGCEQEQRKSTGKRRKSDAVEWILKERIPELQAVVEEENAPQSLGEWLTPFYLPGFCPHLARLERDGKPVTHLVDEGADPVFVREYVGHSHGSGLAPRQLTRVQARYKRRQAEKLKTEVLPFVERIFG